METVTKVTAQKLYDIANRYVDNSFNFIQVEVLEKMSDNMLFEHIDQDSREDKVEDFLFSTSLEDQFNNWYSENYEADEPRTDLTSEEEAEKMIEFVEEDNENEFDDYMSEREQENYPMWNTCFEYRYEPTEDEVNAAIKSGFGVIRGVDGFNTLLFVAGCGYSFYGTHWIPTVIEFGYMVTKEEAEGVKFDMM